LFYYYFGKEFDTHYRSPNPGPYNNTRRKLTGYLMEAAPKY